MSDRPRFRRPLLALAAVLYLGIAIWRLTQGRLPVAGANAAVAAGFGLLLSAPRGEPDWRSWTAGALIIGGIAVQIALDL